MHHVVLPIMAPPAPALAASIGKENFAFIEFVLNAEKKNAKNTKTLDLIIVIKNLYYICR